MRDFLILLFFSLPLVLNAQVTGCPSCDKCGFKLIERPVNARWSVEGDGSVATPLQFTNDIAAPNDNAHYITGITGARGWTVGGGTVWWRVIQVAHGFSVFEHISWDRTGMFWELASTLDLVLLHEGVVGYVESPDVFWIVIPGELIKVPSHGYPAWNWLFAQDAYSTLLTVPDDDFDDVVGIATDDPDWMIAVNNRARLYTISPRMGQFSNGSIPQKTTQVIDRNVANPSLILGKSGGGTSLEVHLYDTILYHTVPDTIELILGTDNLPVMNYIYLADTSKTGDSVSLFVNTTGWPDTMQHAPVAKVLAPSGTFIKGNGPLMHINSVNHLYDTLGQGHLADINEKLRDFHPQWINGADFNITILPNSSGPDSVFLFIDTAKIFQLHYREHIDYPLSGIDTILNGFVANSSPTKYIRTNDLSELLDNANGDTLVVAPDSVLAFYSLVFWGSINEDTTDCKLFVNLPTGSYADSLSLASDIYNYAVYDIPSEYRGTAFLIAKYDIRYDSTAGGTFSVLDSCDLRGVLPDTGYRPGCSAIGSIIDTIQNHLFEHDTCCLNVDTLVLQMDTVLLDIDTLMLDVDTLQVYIDTISSPAIAFYTLKSNQLLNATDTIKYDSLRINSNSYWISAAPTNGKNIFTLKSPAYYNIDVSSLPVSGGTYNYSSQVFANGVAVRPVMQAVEGAGTTGFNTHISVTIDATVADVKMLVKTSGLTSTPSLSAVSTTIRIFRIWAP